MQRCVYAFLLVAVACLGLPAGPALAVDAAPARAPFADRMAALKQVTQVAPPQARGEVKAALRPAPEVGVAQLRSEMRLPTVAGRALGEAPVRTVAEPPVTQPWQGTTRAPEGGYSGAAAAPASATQWPKVSAPLAVPPPAAVPQPTRVVPEYRPPPLVPIRPSSLEGLVDLLLQAADFATYQLCAESASMPVTCTPDVPLGTPVPIDVDGDAIPDVTGRIGPSANTDFPTGLTLAFEVVRLTTDHPLPGHVFAVFEVPEAAKRASLGFDGRDSTLAAKSTMRFTLKNLTDALAGLQSFVASMTHDAPGERSGITFSIASLPANTDPIVGSLTFQPVPSSVSADVSLNRLPGHDEHDVVVTSTEEPVVDAHLVLRAAASKREIAATVDKLPSRVHAHFAAAPSGDAVASYDADAPIDRVVFTDDQTPDVAAPGVHRVVSGQVEGIPQSVELTAAPSLGFHYRSSAPLRSAVARVEQFGGPALVSAIAGLVEGVPTDVAVQVSTPPEGSARLTYRANDVLPHLAVSATDAVSGLTGTVDVRDIPRAVDLLVQPAVAEVSADEPIGVVEATVSVKGASAPRFDGDFASLNVPGGGAAAAAFRITGLRSARMEQTRSGTAARFDFPDRGARTFQIDAEAAGLVAIGSLSSIPQHVELTAQDGFVHYAASDSIAQLAFKGVAAGATFNAALADLPADVAVTYSTGTPVKIGYVASAPITSMAASVTRGDVTATAAIAKLPPRFDLSLDAAAQTASFQASAPVQSITGHVSAKGGAGGSIEGRDFTVLRKAGDAVGLDFKISGLRSIAVDPRAGTHRLELDPGGQPYTAFLDLGDRRISLEVSQLPKTVTADVKDAFKSFTMDSGAPISSVKAAYAEPGTGLTGTLDVTNIPSHLEATLQAGPAPVLTYSASGTISKIVASYREGAGKTALDATITGLPPYVQLVSVPGRFTFDARTSPAGVAGSASLGSIAAAYASNGIFLTGVPVDDHITLKQTPTVMQADVRYTGLSYLNADTANDQVHADVRSSTPKVFLVNADTVDGVVSARIDKLPANLKADLVGTTLRYQASSVIDLLDLRADRGAGEVLNATVKGIPQIVNVAADLTTPTKVSVSASSGMPFVSFAYDKPGLGLALDVSNLPPNLSTVLDTTNNRLDVRADAPIGSISGRVSVNGGTAPTIVGIDHAVINAKGAALGADFRVGGLKRVLFDPVGGGKYAVELVPGGQAFQALATIDDKTARLDVTQLPQSLALDLQSGTNHFAYSAATGIKAVTASYNEVNTGVSALADLIELPASIDASWTLGLAPVVTYRASGVLGRIHLTFSEGKDRSALDLTVNSLPQFVQATASLGRVTFDARDAAPPGGKPKGIGSIVLKYGSGGVFLTGTPSSDHLVVRQSAQDTRAELQYSGLQAASVDITNGLAASLRNSAARPFELDISAPSMSAVGSIKDVPAALDISVSGGVASYTASSVIDDATLAIIAPGGDRLTTTLKGIPESMQLVVDPSAKQIRWTSSKTLSLVAVDVHMIDNVTARTIDAGLSLTGIPVQWQLDFEPSHPRFDAFAGSIGSISAFFTNHGATTRPLGDHASVVLRTPDGDLDASVRVSGLKLAEVEQREVGFRGDVRAGDGTRPFDVNVDIVSDAGRQTTLLKADLTPLPSSIQFEQNDGSISYTASQNFDLVGMAQLGSTKGLANTPAPMPLKNPVFPFLELKSGFSVRDGADCTGNVCANALKANFVLSGFPRHIVLNLAPKDPSQDSIATMTGFNPAPTLNFILLDVQLSHVTARPVTLTASQLDIPSNIDMTLGPIYVQTEGEQKSVQASYTATKAMGKLVVNLESAAENDDLAANLQVSNIPASKRIILPGGFSFLLPAVSIDAFVAPGVKIEADTQSDKGHARISLGAQIDDILVRLKHAGSPTFDAVVDFSQVPESVDLTFGMVSSTDNGVPLGDSDACGNSALAIPRVIQLDYTASDNTLDIAADINAKTFDEAGVDAGISLDVTDLAKRVTIKVDKTQIIPNGTRLQISSTDGAGNPQNTKLFDVHLSTTFQFQYHICFPEKPGTFFIEVKGEVSAQPIKIDDLNLKFTDFSSVKIVLGITTLVQGSFGTVHFGVASVTINLDADMAVRACAGIPGFTVCPITLFDASVHFKEQPISVRFHVARNSSGDFIDKNLDVPGLNPDPFTCVDKDGAVHQLNAVLSINPAPETSSVDGFTITGPAKDAKQALVTINPRVAGSELLSTELAQLLAVFTNPLGVKLPTVSFVCKA